MDYLSLNRRKQSLYLEADTTSRGGRLLGQDWELVDRGRAEREAGCCIWEESRQGWLLEGSYGILTMEDSRLRRNHLHSVTSNYFCLKTLCVKNHPRSCYLCYHDRVKA